MSVYRCLWLSPPRGRGSAVQKLSGVFGEQFRFSCRVRQPLEQGVLESTIHQLPAKTAQDGNIESFIRGPHPQGMLPPEVEAHVLFEFFSSWKVVVCVGVRK